MQNHSNINDIGVIGLGVMGKNLALNIADNQYHVSAFDLDPVKVNGVIQQEKQERAGLESRILGCANLTEMLASLTKPRILVLSVPAGAPVDGVCSALISAGIESDDIVIDTGNSLWTDTVEREARYKGQFVFFSSAVSGGEVGARFGPHLCLAVISMHGIMLRRFGKPLPLRLMPKLGYLSNASSRVIP